MMEACALTSGIEVSPNMGDMECTCFTHYVGRQTCLSDDAKIVSRQFDINIKEKQSFKLWYILHKDRYR